MSSRYSREDREYRSGRDRSRSRSRSPKRRDNDYSKSRDKEYDKREYDYKKEYKRDIEYLKYEDKHKKEDKSCKTEVNDNKKPEANYPKPPEQSSTSTQEKKPASFGLISKNKIKMGIPSIQMKLGVNSNKPKLSVASAFNQDSDEEPEQMPAEARMRMKNIGRNTPTSSGPNSFGKTKQGFSDGKKVFERNLREAMEAARADD